jgi:hypothetical protein
MPLVSRMIQRTIPTKAIVVSLASVVNHPNRFVRPPVSVVNSRSLGTGGGPVGLY